VREKLHLTQNEKETIEHIICPDGGGARARPRGRHRGYALFLYRKARRIGRSSSRGRAGSTRAARIDRILTGKYTAIPAFIGIMALVFWLTFNVIGAALQNLLSCTASALQTIRRPRVYGLARQRRGSLPRDRRNFQRRRNRPEFSADHRHAVFLPLASGRYRLHGEDRLRDGQAAAENRSVGPKHRPDADRIRMQRYRRSCPAARFLLSATAR
jgi:hypothetical protein